MKDVANFVRGLTRPAVTFGLVAVVAALAMHGNLDPDKVFEMALVTVTFWFSDRTISKKDR